MSNRHRPRQEPTTLILTDAQPTPSYSVFQGSGVNTATDLGTAALPTQLVFDSSVVGTPLVAPTANVPTASVTGTADPKSAAPTSTPESTPAPSSSSSHNDLPVAAIIMAVIAAAAIASLFAFLWYRKRARRRGHTHADSPDVRGPPAGDVLRKLGPGYDQPDPFSDAHAVDPFADPEKAEYAPAHIRSGSDSSLGMSAPRQPYTHAASASTGSSASGKIKKKEVEVARQKDMVALNNLVRALDHKERIADREGRDRRSLPPVELFKAALSHSASLSS
ncbi:hypothetical protein FRC10_000966 [Ceratobasidium sp. 414]|nr:hypothetical protein FRC10_000966 [Ceratobasidium sp. 414]